MERVRIRWKRCSELGVILVAVACGGGGDKPGGGVVNPPIRVPATITFEGSAPRGTVGASVGTVSVIVRAADGNPVARTAVSFSVSAGSLTATSAQTDDAGRATSGAWTLGTVAGAQTLTATAGAATAQLNASAVAAAAAKLELLTGLPANIRAGVEVTPPPVVRALDQFNNVVSTGGLQVTASIQTGGGTIRGTTATIDSTGRASFPLLAVGGTVGPRVLAFTAAGLPPIASGSVQLDPGLAATVTLTNVPATARAGIAVAPAIVATVADAFGNALTKPATTVTATVAAGGGVVAGGTATTDASGSATFNALTIEGLVGDKRLRFGADQASVTTGNIPLFAGTAFKLLAEQVPPRTPNAAIFPTPLKVRVTDRFNNAVGEARPMDAAITSGGGTLINGSAQGDASGVATFTQLKIVGLIGTRVLTFTSPGLTPGTATFELDPGPVRSFVLVQPPSASVNSDVPFPQQPALQAADTSGNLIRTEGILVRATLLDATGDLVNESAVTDVSGIARYDQLTYFAPPSVPPAFRLRFSSGLQAVLTTGSIAVTPPAVRQVASIQFEPTTTKLFLLGIGSTVPVTAVARNAGGVPLASSFVVYSSANPAVADISSAGVMRGRGQGSAWIRAIGSGSPTVRDSVYVTVPRDATGPLVYATQATPIIVRPNTTYTFDIVLDPRSTTVGAATILVGVPQELVTNTGISWQGATGTQIGFDTGLNTMRISYVNAAGLSAPAALARVTINTGTPDFFATREIVITPYEVVGINLVNLTPRSSGANIPLQP